MTLGLLGPSRAIAQMPIDEPPHQEHGQALILAELGASTASAVLTIHNASHARRGERSVGWALAGVAVGTLALSASTSNEAQVKAFDVVAGMGAVVSGVARLAVREPSPQVGVACRKVEVDTGSRSVAVRLLF